MKNPERTIYEQLYTRQSSGQYASGYGHNSHGEGFVAHLLGMAPASVLDCGCGHNEFARDIRHHGIKAWGVDFACPSADELVDLLALPYGAKEWDFLTAWDVLEHLQPHQVEPALAEMARVSRRFAFTISHCDSYHRLDGRTLHPTVRPEVWWEERIIRYASRLECIDQYWTGEWA